MDTLVASHTSALCAIRKARRIYQALPWASLGRVEQRRALANARANVRDIDFPLLERYGLWMGLESEKVDVLVARSADRRHRGNITCHALSQRLPDHALVQIAPGIFCTSPAFTALLYSRGRTLGETLALLLELLGTYSLPEEATHPIAWGGIWPDEQDRNTAQQAHYGCEPAVTMQELKAVARWATSSSDRTFKQAVALAKPGAASPAEAIMFGMLGAPMRYGGFGCDSLPKGGISLNYQIDFDSHAARMSSGIPYAVCDAFVHAAVTDIEYNGIGHETENYRIHDGNRNNGLKGMGVKVIVINKEQMRDLVALEEIARQLHRDAGVRFRYRIEGYRVRQASLLNGLRKGCGLPPA